MDTIIRCHVKNNLRLDNLERELISWREKGLESLGGLFIVDDGSPMWEDVKRLAGKYGAEYIKAVGVPDTKNGLYNSLKIATNFPVFCCVDDAVFGAGITERLNLLLGTELYKIPEYGMVGLFACYEDGTRNPNRIPDTDLWKVDPNILYALVGHVFSERLARVVVWEWENIQAGKLPHPQKCDDLWVVDILKKYNISAYNTMRDYVQHTGMNNRTFGDNAGSEYYSKMFVGE
jgi:hypothetical protein